MSHLPRFRARYCQPWYLTRPWIPRAFRGCDEFHNPSWSLIFPFALGGVDVWRMRYPRTPGAEHLHGRFMGVWEGLDVQGCPICVEIKADL